MSHIAFRFAWALSFALSGCATQIFNIPNAERQNPARVQIFDSLNSSAEKVGSYLKQRGQYQSRAMTNTGREIRFLQPWIRDSSLRFYSRRGGQRLRYLSAWKAMWTLREIAPLKTELEVTVLEVIFVGSPEDAGKGPDMDHKSSWFETDPDHLRSALLLRRFWNTQFPLKALPLEIANLNVPDLNFAPLGAALKRRPQTYSRPKSF